jgi:hypothetical protein
MKKGMMILLSVIFFVGSIIALGEISLVETETLNSENGICEYYEVEFNTNDEDTISINGVDLNIKYLGNKIWNLNGWEGEIKNDDFFTRNDESRLNSVRFDFSGMGQYSPDGNFKISEQTYYPWDCQGYSQSAGLVSEMEVNEGWNLVPYSSFSLRDCSYALEGELCVQDILVTYIYIPGLNKYFTEEEIEKEYDSNPVLKDYFSEESEFALLKSSKWIYIKPGSGNKKVIGNFGAYIPYRSQYLDDNPDGQYRLRSGWNFLFIDAFMGYDDNWDINPLSIDEMKGSCNIERAFIWDWQDQAWVDMYVEGPDIFAEFFGAGFVMKVSDDCAFGSSGSGVSPPGLPGGNGITGDYDVDCRDSDGGLDYFTNGTATYGEFDYEDSCGRPGTVNVGTPQEYTIIEGDVLEFACYGPNGDTRCSTSSCRFIQYNCPNGCLDGACIE